MLTLKLFYFGLIVLMCNKYEENYKFWFNNEKKGTLMTEN